MRRQVTASIITSALVVILLTGSACAFDSSDQEKQRTFKVIKNVLAFAIQEYPDFKYIDLFEKTKSEHNIIMHFFPYSIFIDFKILNKYKDSPAYWLGMQDRAFQRGVPYSFKIESDEEFIAFVTLHELGHAKQHLEGSWLGVDYEIDDDMSISEDYLSSPSEIEADYFAAIMLNKWKAYKKELAADNAIKLKTHKRHRLVDLRQRQQYFKMLTPNDAGFTNERQRLLRSALSVKTETTKN